jgi:hypothetical protein
VLDTTAAWLAALIDGEGSIMLGKRESGPRNLRQPHYRAVVAIANTDFRLMEALVNRVGDGQVYEHRVSNTRASHNPRKNRQWTWRMNANQIRVWLPPVRPWLVLKDEQAELLLEALELKARYGSEGRYPNAAQVIQIRDRLTEIYQAIRALNTRGRVAPEEVV